MLGPVETNCPTRYAVVVSDSQHRVTEIVEALGGESEASTPEELLPFVYDELRALARHYLGGERIGHTLQPTALVHEAFMRLVDQRRVTWKGRRHFFAVGARMMRRVLVDWARKHKSRKRGGDWQRVTLTGVGLGSDLALDEVLALDQALASLAELDARQAEIVELRFFAGFSVEEAAELLGVSKRTVEGDWTHARAWLKRELTRIETDNEDSIGAED